MDDPTGGTNDEQTASQPEASARRVRLPDEFDDSEDDGRSESSDIEVTPKKETKKQRNERMARNKKIETKRAAVVEENARKKQVYEDSRPGRIPDGLGVILIGSRHERDNSFWNALGRHFYYSGLNNCVYAGKTAATAADYEGRYNTPYGPTTTRRLYSILPRGLPMNPHEVKRGIRLVNDRSELSLDRVDAYRLLEEFHRIASRFIPALRDRAMHGILEDDGYVKQVSRPFPGDRGLWEDFPIRRNEDAFETNRRNKTAGAGLAPPDSSRMLDIDHWAQYLLHHGRIGSENPVVGIVMNYAYQVDRRSVFGYILGRALGPRQNKPRSEFMRIYACLLAQPHFYHDAIDTWDQTHPNQPYIEATGGTIAIRSMDRPLESAGGRGH